MATYNIIPNGGTFTDVADTLTANGGVGITSAQASTMFAKAANIRWDAKYKPVILAEYLPDRTKAWWKGADGFCGMNLSNARHAGSAENLWDALVGKIDGKMNGWVYANPTGGASSPFRIADFGGYAVNGQMIGSYAIDDRASNGVDSATINAEIPLTIPNEETLAWGDFDTLKDYYFGLIVTSGDLMRARTSDQPIRISTKVALPTNSLKQGTWRAFPFISQYPILEDKDSGVTGLFYTVPNTNITEVTIAPDTPIIEVTSQKTSALEIKSSLYVYNPTSAAIRFTTNTIALREGNSEVNSMVATLPDFTVPAKSEYRIEQKDMPVFEMVTGTLYKNARIWVFLQGNVYSASTIPLEPAEVLATIGL